MAAEHQVAGTAAPVPVELRINGPWQFFAVGTKLHLIFRQRDVRSRAGRCEQVFLRVCSVTERCLQCKWDWIILQWSSASVDNVLLGVIQVG